MMQTWDEYAADQRHERNQLARTTNKLLGWILAFLITLTLFVVVPILLYLANR